MARSLTIKHEESASTSPLLTGFLLIAVGWLLAAMLFGGQAEAFPQVDANAPAPLISGQ